jgi:hypothetical protein
MGISRLYHRVISSYRSLVRNVTMEQEGILRMHPSVIQGQTLRRIILDQGFRSKLRMQKESWTNERAPPRFDLLVLA